MTEINDFTTNPASVVLAVGSSHWPTPWDYIEEAGYFPTHVVEDGQLTEVVDMGQNRGVHLAIPGIPNLPGEYEFKPGLSQIGIIHRQARMVWEGDTETLAVLMEAADLFEWEEKGIAEAKAKLMCSDAATILREVDLAEFPFLAWRVHHLIWHVARQPGFQRFVENINLHFAPGVCCYAPMAVRSFVQYTKDDAPQTNDDGRITTVHIVDDASKFHDPTGRTQR